MIVLLHGRLICEENISIKLVPIVEHVGYILSPLDPGSSITAINHVSDFEEWWKTCWVLVLNIIVDLSVDEFLNTTFVFGPQLSIRIPNGIESFSSDHHIFGFASFELRSDLDYSTRNCDLLYFEKIHGKNSFVTIVTIITLLQLLIYNFSL